MRSSRFVAFFSFMFFASAPAVAQDSASARKGKTAFVAVEPIGLTLMPVAGLRAGYFINPDLTAEVGFATGSAEIGDFKAEKTLIEAKAKYFFANSFYVDAGLAHENWTVDYSVTNLLDSSQKAKFEADVTNTGASIHIGNQWQWDGFTLGCDWVGYFVSLAGEAKFSSSTTVNEEERKKEEEDVESTVGGGSVHLTRLYLGWAF